MLELRFVIRYLYMSVVSVVTTLQAGRSLVLISNRGKQFSSFPKRPDRLCCLLISGYRGLFSGIELATHLHLLP